MKAGIQITVVLMTLLLSPQSYANTNQALMELLKALEENGTINKDVYDMVVVAAGQGTSSRQDVARKREIREVVKEEVSAATASDVKSGDGDFSLRVGGRIQADAATYSEDLRQHNDGTEIRRARLFA